MAFVVSFEYFLTFRRTVLREEILDTPLIRCMAKMLERRNGKFFSFLEFPFYQAIALIKKYREVQF